MKLFRYTDRLNDDHPLITLHELEVIRETPCCWVIHRLEGYPACGERKVFKNARVSYAYPTVDLARASFEIRKNKQLSYLSRQHDHVAAIVRRIDAGTAYEPLQMCDPPFGGVFDQPQGEPRP